MVRSILVMFVVAVLDVAVGVAVDGGLANRAHAQAAKAAAPASGTQYKSKTVYDFDDDLVEGDLVRPDGEMGDSLVKARHTTLIKPRTEFLQEIYKSAEDL